MDIMALVDRIEESMDAGRSVPLARGRLIDTDKVYEIIDDFEHWLLPRMSRFITPAEAPVSAAPVDRL